MRTPRLLRHALRPFGAFDPVTTPVVSVTAGNGGSGTARGATLLLVATCVMHACSFAFYVVTSRLLDSAAYGALGALTAIIFVLTVPASALQVAIVGEVAGDWQEEADSAGLISIRRLAQRASAVGVAGFLLVGSASPMLASFLHLDSAAGVLILGALVLPAVLNIVFRSVLLGRMQYGPVALSLTVTAVGRLVLAFVLVRTGAGVEGAVGATVLGEWLGVFSLIPSVREWLLRKEGGWSVSIRVREVVGAVLAFAGFWMLVGTDSFLARHYLPAHSSGLYAAAATAARAVLFLPLAVSMVALPMFAASKNDPSRSRQILCRSLAIAAFVCLSSALVLSVVPSQVITLLFGQTYETSTTVMAELAFASAFTALSYVVMTFHLARGSSAAQLCWAGLAVGTLGIALFHSSLESVATVTLVTSTATLTALVACAVRTLSKSPMTESVAFTSTESS